MQKDIEDKLQEAISAGEHTTEQARSLMAAMSQLKHLLLIKEGAGRRYLQHVQPSMKQLKQVEQVILSHYNTVTKTPELRKKSKSSLVRTVSQRGI